MSTQAAAPETLTPNDIRAMHFARMMQTDPNTSDPIAAVRNNAWSNDTIAADMADYEHGDDLLKRYVLRYTGRSIVADLAFRQVPADAVGSERLDAGHIATSQAYRYGYALPK